MNDLPLVSISCITFNHARYLRECFDGFMMQITNFKFEIVVHDDVSTDGTKAIIEEYTQKYPNVFFPMYQTENQYSKGVRGFMPKFNFPRCRGKYIALCEGDDYWTDPNKLQKQVDFLEANEDYIIHSGNAKILSDNEQNNSLIINSLKDESFVLEDFYFKNNIATCTVMLRNPKININENYNGINFGDWFTYVILLKNSKLKAYRSTDIYSAYRVHGGGVMSSMNLENNFHSHINQIIKINKYLGGKPFSNEVLDVLNNYYFDIFTIHHKNSEHIKALKIIYKNLLTCYKKFQFRRYLGYYRTHFLHK